MPLIALLALLALALPATASAQQPPADDPSLPLVYVFSLDGLDGDRVDAGKAPFIGSLVNGAQQNRATYYRESRSIMVAETNPNHVAMATGAFGDRSGIPGNAFAVYGDAARKACNAGDDGTTDGEVATCMVAESFLTAMRRLAPGRITTAGIFGKPKLAQIFATKRISPDRYDADHLWSPCDPQDRSDFCDPQAPARPNDGYAVLDVEVMDEVLATVNDGVGPQRKRPNLTFVNLPTIDSAGHANGVDTGLYDQAIAQADAEIQRFVTNQKAKGLWARTIMFLVSDHSMDTTLGKTSLTQRFSSGGLSDGVVVVQNGSLDMVYLENRNDPQRFEKLKALRANAIAAGNVDEALYREPNPADGGVPHTLDFVHPGWRIAGDRTGDLVVTHKVGGSFSEPVNPLVGNHGSPLTTDNTFIVTGGSPLVKQQGIGGTVGPRFDDALLNPGSAQNVDVAPTVMAIFGMQGPANSEGRVLIEAFNVPALRQVQQTATPGGITTTPTGAAQRPRAQRCTVTRGFRAASVRAAGRRGLRFGLSPRGSGGVSVDVFQQSRGRVVLGNRLVARFRGRRASFTRARIPGGDGIYMVRLRAGGEERRFALRRVRGRFRVSAGFDRRDSCGLLSSFKLDRAVFGGRSNRALGIAFRLTQDARVSVDVRRGGRLVRRFAPTTRRAGLTHRLRLSSEDLPRGTHEIRLTATAGRERVTARLVSRRL